MDINFFVPSNAGKGNIMLHVSVDSTLGGNTFPNLPGNGSDYAPANITGSTIRMGLGGGSSLNENDKIVLIRASTGSTFSAYTLDDNGLPEPLTATVGSLRECTFKLSVETDDTYDLVATLTNQPILSASGSNGPFRLLPHSKTLLEGVEAAMTLLGSTVDLAVNAFPSISLRDGLFACVSGGRSRYLSGSHVDCNEFSAIVGLGKLWECSHGQCSASAFAEGALGTYESSNTFPTGNVKGSGDTRSLGGGILGRIDGIESASGHFYGEGSAHGGRIKHDFLSNDIVDMRGIKAAYASTATYFGAHGGIGYIREVGDSASIDVYGKFIWVRRFGNSVTVSTGETVALKNSDSQRLLTGLRLLHTISNGATLFLGGACNYEFAGKVNATLEGMNLDSPSLRGASAIAEAGIRGDWDGNTLSLGISGYAGKRRGASAHFSFERMF
jgi:hypothetical protein